MNRATADTFLGAILSREPVGGYTHDFYRHNAGFSSGLSRVVLGSLRTFVTVL